MITVSAPAKINLIFQVAELAGDGYHPVNSLYLELDLRDRLTLVPTSENNAVGIFVSSATLPARHVNAVPTDQSNLVYAVAEKMFSSRGLKLSGFDILIDKNIPVAGGMAGGSADAAAMLIACNHYLNQIHGTRLLAENELIELAKQFGSDVPFSLQGGLAIGTNRGERLEQLAPLDFESHFVIAISHEGLSTASVYSRFDEIGKSTPFTKLADPISDIHQLASLMSNDLETVAVTLLPGITNTLELLTLSGALKAMVTGSGPTAIGLFDSAKSAKKAAETVSELGLIGMVAVPSYLGTRLES